MYLLTRPPFEEVRIAADKTDKDKYNGGGGGKTIVERSTKRQIEE